MLKQCHVNKQKDDFSSVLQQNVLKKEDFTRFVCVRIAAAVDNINKMADCRLSRLEGKQGKFLLLFLSNDCMIK